MASALAPGTPVLYPLHELSVAGDRPSLALKRIKNELTGHSLRKIEYIRNGTVPALTEILFNVLAELQTTGATAPKPEDEDTFAQIAQIFCVIAHEGPSLVQPLLETDVLRGLISCLLIPVSSRTSLAVLRCLNAVAENLPPADSEQWLPHRELADLLYSKRYISCFANIIAGAGDTGVSQQACDAVLALLCKTATLEWQKRSLVESGVLSLLSARLASFVVAEGLVPPSPESLLDDDGTRARMPRPAPSFAHLSPVLESLSILIEHSRKRANLFLSDPTVKAVLPDLKDGFSPTDIRQAPWGVSYFSGAAVPRLCPHGPFDYLLPSMPISDGAKSAMQSGFPPLGSIAALPKRRASFLPTTAVPPRLALNHVSTDETQESSVIPWLLSTVRESKAKRRLLAAKLLVDLCGLGLVTRGRRASFAALLVPLLTRMLVSDAVQTDQSDGFRGSHLCGGLHYTRAVPAVLAALVMDDPGMQKVAVDSNAIAALSAGLKLTFDGPARRKPSPWQPYKITEMETEQTLPGTRLGTGGPTWTVRREMDYREGCLRALAAIAPFEDDYRKEICDQGVLTHVMLALEPYQVQYSLGRRVEATGNPVPVVLAACGVVRVLTRSVKALRTKLIEADVAKPIINLMSSTNPELRIAATKVLANLAIDFSPVKESVGDSAVVKKLCEQAHSANARLRLESLWALKQLVLNASKKLKQDVVDELGPSWIKLLIKTDPNDIPKGEVIGLVEREYPPLTSDPRPSSGRNNTHDVVMSDDSDDGLDIAQTLGNDASFDGSTGFDTRHTTEDDTEIQAQLLDLLRNLFCGDNASDLVKYILDEVGQDDFFRIMLDRLRPRTIAGPTRKENYTTPAPSAIVVKVLYILVHVGACDSRWRNAIASHHALMKQVLTFCSHSDREIRAQCCWIAINLTYEDDASDRLACKHRAVELQKIGFVTQLRKLEGDPDLNVRERAKSAIHLLSKLIAQ
ncbi:hypothetical protein A1O3_08328 [Capronia epimyces CBS 606.96]|uniref:Uncharacterized protein n=1 Tax=Capronia epimyces CBS 606.96 TaxID=1182542 RepID=W9XHP2_9EURO|nr:uncharacterized protein A1O3_08328 [Capronia epimyces CBS 606.96]EXJ80042.1 hypothetical protein A1O3_08328 [Capronia epimyces CBS 606.96]